MASLERRITRATSGGATPATEATEVAPGPTTQEIDDLVADQGGNMASKLADLQKRVEEERAYFNTMKEALEVFRGSHGDNYNAYPEALQDFARKQAQIQEKSRHKSVRTQGTQLTVIAYESASRRLNGCYPIGLL
ncbi:hypothetical protein GMDG_01725 [Pseudogymnoascus destructans 20631-21]|uniref:Uncharacterized protein n=1 Tax=Pseudogymnoascus destructans (strain ATCC MYA-4855 / 20631-21) TaxID=658429 RepID=L8FWU5_PSED2|nr:hypothetical protein GMDG_01725 [Pseudogymnoascus destructans 20631-21]